MNYYQLSIFLSNSEKEKEDNMERRHSKFVLFLLPLALYVAIMFKMIENVYQNELSKENGLLINNKKRNISSHLHMLVIEYEQIELQRRAILENIDSLTIRRNTGSANSVIPEFSLGLQESLAQYRLEQHHSNSDKSKYVVKPKNLFNCENIPEIKLKQKIGHGVSKQTFLGEYRGTVVAVKMVTRHQKEVRTCLDELRQKVGDKSRVKSSKCFVLPTMKLMKEFLLLEQLSHAGFLELLGYCVRSEESDSTDLSEHGVIGIYEPGQRFVADTLQYLNIDIRLNHALHLSKFLNYLENSPLGSLRVKDFKEEHFLFVNDTIKMIDLDDVDNVEPSCDIYSEEVPSIDLKGRQPCNYGIPCHMGLCIGFNAKHNLLMMNKLFFTKLLKPTSYPAHIQTDLASINAQIEMLYVSAANLVDEISYIIWKVKQDRSQL